MKALGVILAIVAVIVIFGTVTVVVRSRAARAEGRHARRLNEERRKAPWEHYSRPGRYITTEPTRWVVGVERVMLDGSRFDPEEMWVGPLDDDFARIEAEGLAIAKAVKYNDLKVGMQ